jgi:hypothetical protein
MSLLTSPDHVMRSVFDLAHMDAIRVFAGKRFPEKQKSGAMRRFL